MKKAAKKTMKSEKSPFVPFDSFYPLEDLINTYQEIWYADESDSSDNQHNADFKAPEEISHMPLVCEYMQMTIDKDSLKLMEPQDYKPCNLA